VWWHTSIIAVLGELTHEDCKFEASLSYKVRPCLRKKRREKIISKLDIVCMLELSDWKFKTTLISILRTVMSKVDSTQELISNVSRGMKI
jgi:hypothetical protein